MGRTTDRCLAAAFFACLLSFASAARAEDLRVLGVFSGSNQFSSVDGTFDCTGTPTCTGTYAAAFKKEGCSNAHTLTNTLVVTGLDLSRAGPISGVAQFTGTDFDPLYNADGTCTILPGSQGDETLTWTGHWDGRNGTFILRLTDFYDVLEIPGTFRADTPPPVFPMVVRSTIDANRATSVADILFRPQDVGSSGSVFVFGLAPATRVQGGLSSKALRVGTATGPGVKAETPVACVLAQLNSAGQMVAVTSANLAAYLTGVLTAQGASVTILNSVPTADVSGATFFVGYGPDGTSMINTGVNRGAVTVPGAVECRPQAPQTGWWWNPLEDGRGFSLEVRGNNIFFAAFLYDVSGRSTWYVSTGPVSLEGSYYSGDLLSASGGQTLGGPYMRFPTLRTVGNVTLTFNTDMRGTLVWPGGTVPIERFHIVPNGLNLAPVAGQPQSGWWWNPDESGRGFFLEFQGGWLDIAGYMYDDLGDSVWYLTVDQIGGTVAQPSFTQSWWSYGGGQTLTGAWRQNTRLSTNVAPVTITFTSSETALMTLPNGRTTSLRRHRF